MRAIRRPSPAEQEEALRDVEEAYRELADQGIYSLSASPGFLESHAHRQAKRLLLQWLREAAAVDGYDGYAGFPGGAPGCASISWRVNRGAPHYGVWREYPVLSDGTGIIPVWGEEDHERWKNRPRTYEEVVAMGFRPMCVLDIAIQHKGAVEYAIEIVHKHRCDPRKIGFLKPRLTLLEIPAYWVLGQVDRPSEIPAEFFL